MNAERDVSGVDVIVPVFRGLETTRRCIESVLAFRQETPFELVLVDDRSPEAELVAYLDKLAADGRATLLRNEANLGFVASANRGMALHGDRDVVLLNSDTRVAHDWLDRLRRCVRGQPDIGTATPFSNNATICSYPVFCADNALPEGMSLEALDGVFRTVNAGRWIEIPTAVGFCMYIRRACLDQVGLFDTVRFGRGYGEENDFSRRAAGHGWKNALCADTFVYHAGGVSFGAERKALQESGSRALLAVHPDYDALIQHFITLDPPAALRRAVALEIEKTRRDGLRGVPPVEAMTDRAGVDREKPVQLHVTHDLGGGIAQWLGDYCRADTERTNLVLKPYSRSPASGEGLALYGSAADAFPLRLWLFSAPIEAAVVEHAEYRDVIRAVIDEFGVDGIVVSSLIGHSLDVLDTGLPTLVVCHDYFPYCPAINIHYQGICTQCGAARLAECYAHNPDFNPFREFPPELRVRVREGFVERTAAGRLTLVAPSQSVLDHLVRLEPRFRKGGAVVIPHGHGTVFENLECGEAGSEGRLRILILGMLAPSKGVGLLKDACAEITAFADLYLVGSGELGALFEGEAGVHVLGGYTLDALPEIVRRIAPHAGLLMSVCAETYGYTLGELMMLGVPPVATRVGAFAERIRPGQTGYLYEPTAAALVQCLREIDVDRSGLASVATHLRDVRMRSAAEMVADYHRLMPLRRGGAADQLALRSPAILDHSVIGLAMELSARWKEIRSLHLSLGVRDALIAKHVQRHRAAEASFAEHERVISDLRIQVEGMLRSTSWKVSRPLRWGGRLLRRIRALPRAGHCTSMNGLGQSTPGTAKASAIPLESPCEVPPSEGDWRQAAFRGYHASLNQDTRNAMRARIRAMSSRPRISVLVPVFNTPADMLRTMLDSVLAQIYAEWELCIADDASDLPHVKPILEAYAAREPRIRLDFTIENGGVSRATNRALALATGGFAVLLDHDDLLEEQALFRVAEAVAQDDPDMLYSDEVLVGEDGRTVQHFIFRPSFSPEYLRSHPYIVHLVGFRTSLLRDLGGLDETLRISQDYDLILRASERARRIVHVPDLLYRWRIHGDSAGHAMIDQVMATSSEILRHHLQRCGEEGTVEPGPSFNYFDVRYPLKAGLKVAILIPTRNHADLVRACIESIERTTGEVEREIVLIDHDSDDPVSLAYFASLGSRVRLLRYSGPFNFAAINNWAVSQLDGSHSHYLFCNNDIEAIEPGWLGRMLELGQRPDVGVVGAKLFYPDRTTIQHAGVVVACCGVAENLARFRQTSESEVDIGYVGSLICNREVSAVTAACMLVRRDVFEAIRGFDEAIAVGYGDVDLCLRAGERGYRVLFCAHAVLLHHESFTRGRSPEDPHPQDSARFTERWQGLFATGDRYFNPNLSPDSPNWQVANPLEFRLDIRRRVFVR